MGNVVVGEREKIKEGWTVLQYVQSVFLCNIVS